MMKLKPYSVIFPLVTLFVAGLGSMFTSGGMEWYDAELIQPEITPPNWVFPIAWNLIFLATTISALIVWNTFKRDDRFKWILGLFLTNGFLNVLWSYLFFGKHLVTLAFYEMLFLELTLLVLHVLTWKKSKNASLLLLPYTLWIAFATYLTYQIILLQA